LVATTRQLGISFFEYVRDDRDPPTIILLFCLDKDAVFPALRVSKYMFFSVFIAKARGFRPSGIGQTFLFPSAICPLPFFGEAILKAAFVVMAAFRQRLGSV
jgi:hypothetical protein